MELLLVYTGKHTGRAAKDKYVVKDSESESKVNWGEINQPIDEERYFSIREKFDYIEKLQKINNKKLMFRIVSLVQIDLTVLT